MSGRHKFSELEARMSTARRARIDRLADKLEKEMSSATAEKPPRQADTDAANPPQARAARSGAAG